MPPRQTVAKSDDSYVVPATLVHRLIVAIFSSLAMIGAYMIIWAVNDVQWKAKQELKGEEILYRVTQNERAIQFGILPRAEERIESLERQIREHGYPGHVGHSGE